MIRREYEQRIACLRAEHRLIHIVEDYHVSVNLRAERVGGHALVNPFQTCTGQPDDRFTQRALEHGL